MANKGPNRIMIAIVVMAVLGGASTALGMGSSRQHFFEAYLIAFIFWACITFGMFGATLLHHSLRTRWALPIARIWEAGGGAEMLVFTAILGIPLLVGMQDLYSWSRPDAVRADAILQHKAPYLNPGFFIIRYVLYFVVFAVFAAVAKKWVVAQERSGDIKWSDKRASLGAGGMLVFVLLATFIFTDWVMSIDPHWYSTIYGVWFVAGQALAAFAVGAAVIGANHDKAPFKDVVDKQLLNDFGNLLLMATMFWAYISLSQFLIIWSGNLPEFNTYYVNRSGFGFNALGAALIIGQFFFPFLYLLWPKAKQNPRSLAFIAGWILVMRAADVYYIVKPTFAGARLAPSLLEIGLFLLVGAAWLFVFLYRLRVRPVEVRMPGVPVVEHV